MYGCVCSEYGKCNDRLFYNNFILKNECCVWWKYVYLVCFGGCYVCGGVWFSGVVYVKFVKGLVVKCVIKVW